MRQGVRLTIVGLLASAGSVANETEGMAVKDDALEAIQTTLLSDFGWRKQDIELSAEPDLDRAGCHFLRATNKARPGAAVARFAVLPDVGVLSTSTDGASASTILRACGDQAPGVWWAHIITRFDGQVPGVVVDPKTTPSAIRKIRAAGRAYSPPELNRNGAAASVSFFTLDHERGVVYQVDAELTDDELVTRQQPVEPD